MYSRILHLIHTPRFSGAEILVRDLCLIHRARGIASAVASFAPAEADFSPAVRSLLDAGTSLFFPDQALKKLARSRFYASAISRFCPDVIYAHSVLPALYGRLALPVWGTHPRFISVLHSASCDDYAGTAFVLSEWALARRGDGVIAVSPLASENYCRRFPHHRPVRVVPNGTNLTAISQANKKAESLRAELGLGSQNKLILQVGRISNIKQQETTFAAALPLLREDKSLRLWFAGLVEDKDVEKRLQEAIRAHNLQDQVSYLGGREDIPELLAAADLFVMPSLKEAHSISMLEALASGIPVVASDILPFAYARAMPGVWLTEIEPNRMTAAMRAALQQKKRFDRDMSAFDIHETAAIYGGYEHEKLVTESETVSNEG